MKTQLTVPSTPIKRRCPAPAVLGDADRLLCEGTYYRIYLTKRKTVLRVAKRRTASDVEIEILERVQGESVNRMLRWWKEDGLKYFEMEYCADGDVAALLVKTRQDGCVDECDEAADWPRSAKHSPVNLDARQERPAEDRGCPGLNSDPFACADELLEQNTSAIVVDDSDCSDVSFAPEAVEPPAWCAAMMRQVAGALALLHGAGYIHMDVKPANILVDGASFKLCDFNISCSGEGSVEIDGDPVYMAPEILKNRCYFSSDLYSLGLVYLELCNPGLRLPRTGPAYRRLRRNNFRGWRLDGIGRRMLESNPAKRCSAAEVYDHFAASV
ncbi:hypothetical protein PAPHI01_1408 [Pancytospora philotis]|nr:hypothetical protein PAPHI01_1408 [Pancytospora philotis]